MTDKNHLITQIKSSLDTAKGGSFVIQAGHVTPLFLKQKEFSKMAEVFPVLFSENDESAYIFWNKIPVRFHYTYEFYANWDDIIHWLLRIVNEKEGRHELTLSTDIFFVEIRSAWKGGWIELSSNWTSKKDNNPMADVLNEKNHISLSCNSFICEWKTLFFQMVHILEKSGIVLTDPAEKEKILQMKKIALAANGEGVLYTKKTPVLS